MLKPKLLLRGLQLTGSCELFFPDRIGGTLPNIKQMDRKPPENNSAGFCDLGYAEVFEQICFPCNLLLQERDFENRNPLFEIAVGNERGAETVIFSTFNH